MQVCAARGSLQIQDAKKSPKIAIWAPSHNFVGLYLLFLQVVQDTGRKGRIAAAHGRLNRIHQVAPM